MKDGKLTSTLPVQRTCPEHTDRFAMASSLQSISGYVAADLPSARSMKFGIIVSDWNREITDALYKGTLRLLMDCGAQEKNLFICRVPGSFELTAAAMLMAENRNPDAVICLGCVIRGETRHADYISHAVAQGITHLSLKYGKPFIFGVLTPNNIRQARARAGGRHGNKGHEAAATAIRMIAIRNKLTGKSSKM